VYVQLNLFEPAKRFRYLQTLAYLPSAIFRQWRPLTTTHPYHLHLLSITSHGADVTFQLNQSCRQPFDSVSCYNSWVTIDSSHVSTCMRACRTSYLYKTALLDETKVSTFTKSISWNWFPLCMTWWQQQNGKNDSTTLFPPLWIIITEKGKNTLLKTTTILM
jgi:hypothetical protein